MEVFFYGGAKFFPQGSKAAQGQEEQFQKKGPDVGQKEADPESEAAQQQEIGHAAQEEAEHEVDAHLAVSGPDGPEEEGGDGAQPKQQIQRLAQKPPFQPRAQDPEQVIEHSQRRAQAGGAQKGPALGGV